jgi:asparagine synthase (glutamine-hydrolysing)
MCGIAGFIGALKSPIEVLLGDVIAHRGPDHVGSFSTSSMDVHLFHQRLSIIDLSDAGNQPMHSHDGKLVLVFNGEIYNFKSVRRDLEKMGYHFRSKSDTEVVLIAYQAWGDSFLTRLNGIYALALWDSDKNQTLLARDPLGVKPLYYAMSQNCMAFSSEIKAIVRLMPEICDLDHAALRRYYSFIYCPGNGTPFRAVKKLDPGSAIWVSEGQIAKGWSFFRLPSLNGTDGSMTEAEAINGTYNGVRDAVRRQMVSDVPIGAFLSGGVDSSALVAIAREMSPQIECFTIETANGRDFGETDDLPFAKLAASYLGVKLNTVEVKPSQIPRDLENMVWHLDEPIADLASLNTLYISKAARAMGIKVLISGTGGDDLFSGYRRHQALMFQERFRNFPGSLQSIFLKMFKNIPARAGFSRRRDKLIQILSDEKNSGIPAYFFWGLKEEVNNLFLESAPNAEEEVMHAFLAGANSNASALQKMLALEQRFFLADHNLNYTDKMGMAAGVEIRVPMLDLDLVTFAAGIPDQFRIKKMQSKWVLKEAMKPHLPPAILTRPKTGFGLPLRRWIKQDLNEYVQDMLCEERVRRRGIFDPKYVAKLISENASGKRDSAFSILSVLCTEIWCQKFIDR